jgi:hypothetical protein
VLITSDHAKTSKIKKPWDGFVTECHEHTFRTTNKISAPRAASAQLRCSVMASCPASSCLMLWAAAIFEYRTDPQPWQRE